MKALGVTIDVSNGAVAALGAAVGPTTVDLTSTRTACEHEAPDMACLSDEERAALDSLLQEFYTVFGDKVGRTTTVVHTINTGTAAPVRCRPYNYSPVKKQVIKEQIEEMLKEGVIEESTSAWAAPAVIVPKKDGSPRFCVDYRKLNAVTTADAYPMINIRDVFDSLHGTKFFSSLDLRSGYWQIMVDEKNREKTAFVTAEGSTSSE